jgi:hypothetical protein
MDLFKPKKRFQWPVWNWPERKENRTLATLTMVEWDGVTQQQYEALRQLVDWEGDSPKGLSFHVAAFDEKGGHFVDVWETAEEFQSFIPGPIDAWRQAGRHAGRAARSDAAGARPFHAWLQVDLVAGSRVGHKPMAFLE